MLALAKKRPRRADGTNSTMNVSETSAARFSATAKPERRSESGRGANRRPSHAATRAAGTEISMSRGTCARLAPGRPNNASIPNWKPTTPVLSSSASSVISLARPERGGLDLPRNDICSSSSEPARWLANLLDGDWLGEV